MATRPKGSVVDGYLDDMAEQHAEARLAVLQAENLRVTCLLRLSQVALVCPDQKESLRAVAVALNAMTVPLQVGIVALDQAGLHVREIREAPAVRRARKEARQDAEERRSRIRREADRVVGHLRVLEGIREYEGATA